MSRCQCLAEFHLDRTTDRQPWCVLPHGHGGPHRTAEGFYFGELKAAKSAIQGRMRLECLRIVRGVQIFLGIR